MNKNMNKNSKYSKSVICSKCGKKYGYDKVIYDKILDIYLCIKCKG